VIVNRKFAIVNFLLYLVGGAVWTNKEVARCGSRSFIFLGSRQLWSLVRILLHNKLSRMFCPHKLMHWNFWWVHFLNFKNLS